MAQVKLFGILRQYAESPQFSQPGETVGNVLQQLCTRKPDLCAAIFHMEQTGLQSRVRIMLNGRDIAMLQGFDTPVSEFDLLAIIPPIAGGFS
jgi:molybdopterin synthase sulfur carrier subunit